MLCLPAPETIVKDASRAVKRVAGLQIQPVNVDILSELLDLPGLGVQQFALEQLGNEKALHLFCEHTHTFAICPRCQLVTRHLYDVKARCVRHLDILEMRTLVHFPQRRFECEHCGKPFTENLAWLRPKRRQTSAFENYIYQRMRHKTPCKQVAQEEGLSESTVRDIFKHRAQQVQRQQRRPAQVRVLGVDEISVRKGHKQYALVISDLERRQVIAVLPNRRKETLRTWLQQLSPAARHAIKLVSMDMWRPYWSAVRELLPHAKIVADRFHMMKQLNHQIDLVRRAMQRQAQKTGDTALYQVLKGSRWVLLKDRADLTSEQRTQLQEILALSVELRQIYRLREEFRHICDKITDRARAERFLRAWALKAERTGNRHMLKFVKTLRNWWEEFLNYFIERTTQGFVEGINRAIRGIINRAFGYRNFDNFRLQVLIECGGT